ncbi:S-adenosyl-L-methionine-dependent methyltransferase, partial [Mycena capillaripes]
WGRLDQVHFALREYLGDKICFAPIYDSSPNKILELGCGSGAWAIDAAIDFPNAEVIAVDLSPIPKDVLLPSNMKFETVDVTQTFPFEEQTFDVVHARLLLMHLPNNKDVLERAAKLVKPGGWLVLDDFDLSSIIKNSGPAVSRVLSTWREILIARDVDADIGKKMEFILQSTGSFSKIGAHKISIPICDNGSG